MRVVNVADSLLCDFPRSVAIVQAIIEVGCVFCLYTQADGAGPWEEGIGKGSGSGEAMARGGDIVGGWEEEGGARFWNSNREETRRMKVARIANGATFEEVWGGSEGTFVFGSFSFVLGGSGEARDGGLIDAGLVMKEDEDVIEGSTNFVGEDFELSVVFHHWDDVLFYHDQPFS